MLGVVLDADSLGKDVDLSPVTQLLDDWQVHPFTRPEQVAERIKHATVVLTNKIALDESSLSSAWALKFVSVMATGTNNIDFLATANRGIKVSNALAYGTPSVVQHTLALILNLSTSFHRYQASISRGDWQASNVFCLLDYPIREIAGKQLGIVGYGELGKAVGTVVAALGMKVVVSEHPGREPREGRTKFEEVLRTSDYISLHCPLNDATSRIINADTLALMKQDAFLINTARGGLVDPYDLVSCLQAGNIAGAAIDVLEQEPPTLNDPLLKDIPNLIVTPHNAWAAIESRNRLIQQSRENIEGFLKGKPVRLVTQ
ncbi:MAG: D-2-hydroxyacid dehydrogenase [Gammaproteobacteria bacterium]|jgi:glycerate dehydrogenase|nr:D-2-hydroxyacid dehydrogenase [Gammaproteobacteria bacterium]